MKKKALDVQLKKKNPFLFLRASCLEMGRITIAQTNINLYSVLMIIVLKIQKDSSTTTYRTETILPTDGRQHNNIIRQHFLRSFKMSILK